MSYQYINQDIAEKILEVAHRMHRNPELSTREYKTTAMLAEELKKLDLEFPAQQPATGVIALLRGGKPGPTLVLRADIDALPIEESRDHQIRSENCGVMHACGHDFHTAAGLGAAMALSRQRDSLPGNILFLFQPAEEECKGALDVLGTGVFEEYPPDAFFSLHVMPDIPMGKVGIRPGPMMAAQGCFTIDVTGKGGHGAMPNLSRNPILAAAGMVEALQTIRSRWADPTKPFSLSVCSIHGGSACNIIPDSVTMEGTFRYAEESYGEAVKEHIVRICESVAKAHECTARCSFYREIFPLINDTRLAEIARKAASALCGEENLFVQDFRMISEDFGFFRKIAPIFMYHVGIGAPDGSSPGLHNYCFQVPDSAAAFCAELMTETILTALSEWDGSDTNISER